MKYAWIADNSHCYRIARMCTLLNVSRSGYYDWRCRKPSQRTIANVKLLTEIQRVHEQSDRHYGAIKCWKQLNREDISCGRHRVARLRKQADIYAERRKRSVVTMQSRQAQYSADDLVGRDFTSSAPNQIWVGDVTHISTLSGWLYVAVLIDLYSRKVVGWSMSTQNNGELVMACLEMAIEQRRPKPGLIHHTDRGSVYTKRKYRKRLERSGMRTSKSRAGNCWDNAVAESFFSTLKNELVHCTEFQNTEQARVAVFDYIERFYNRQRIHRTLDYWTPEQFEAMADAA